MSNIENKAEYEGKSAGINLGAGQNATGKFMLTFTPTYDHCLWLLCQHLVA